MGAKTESLVRIVEFEKAPCCFPTNEFTVVVFDSGGRILPESFSFDSEYKRDENNKIIPGIQLIENEYDSKSDDSYELKSKTVFDEATDRSSGNDRLYQMACSKSNELSIKYGFPIFDSTRRARLATK